MLYPGQVLRCSLPLLSPHSKIYNFIYSFQLLPLHQPPFNLFKLPSFLKTITFAFFRLHFKLKFCLVYLSKTNMMHLHVSNKQVHHQEVIFVHAAYSIFHACIWCIVANTLWLEPNHNVLATRQWKMLYAACTEVTSWWWTCLFETCSGKYKWNQYRK